MSANQKPRLFITARDLERALRACSVRKDDVLAKMAAITYRVRMLQHRIAVGRGHLEL